MKNSVPGSGAGERGYQGEKLTRFADATGTGHFGEAPAHMEAGWAIMFPHH